MADKKIIDKKNVKENNPNDDEEILKNSNTTVWENNEKAEKDESLRKDQNTTGQETIGIP